MLTLLLFSVLPVGVSALPAMRASRSVFLAVLVTTGSTTLAFPLVPILLLLILRH